MITQITPELFIGGAEDSIQADNKIFDAVLCVAIDFDIKDGFKWRHKVGLLDGPGNSPMTFVAAVLLLYSLLKSGKRVLLHCQEGRSRSVMVAATTLAVAGVASFDDALREIMTLRKVDNYRPALYDMAKVTLPLIKETVTKTYG